MKLFLLAIGINPSRWVSWLYFFQLAKARWRLTWTIYYLTLLAKWVIESAKEKLYLCSEGTFSGSIFENRWRNAIRCKVMAILLNCPHLHWGGEIYSSIYSLFKFASFSPVSPFTNLKSKSSEYVEWPARRSWYGFIREDVQKQARGPPEKPL